MLSSETQWSVFTGAPTSGKSTVLSELKALGYPIRKEFARRFIMSEKKKGRTIEDLCSDQQSFQGSLLRLGSAEDSLMSTDTPYFLDRSPIDAVAHHFLRELDMTGVLQIARRHKYRHVFYFESLPFEDDGVRIEKSREEVLQLEQCFRRAYAELGYNVIEVPLFSANRESSIKQRIQFVLSHLGPYA